MPRNILAMMANFSWTTFIVSVLGSGAIAPLAIRWLGDRWLAKYKTGLEKELESYRDTLEQRRRQVEAQLGHSLYVSQVQFDAEFNALKETFSALGRVKLAFNGMRPMLSWGHTDPESKLNVLGSRLAEFKKSYNELVDVAHSLYPFVPEEIYQQVHECMKRASIEVMHIETAGKETFTPAWYEDGAKQLEQFNAAYFSAANLVRQRFKQLSVVPGGSRL